MIQKNLKGFSVSFLEEAKNGFEHLAYVLSFDETCSLFDNAKMSGKIEFEDRLGRNYTLLSKLNGNFEIKERK